MPNDHTYCRTLLNLVMVDVRDKFTAEEIKAAWAWNVSIGSRQQFEFHGPRGHYNHDVRLADCRWSAMAGGWQGLLNQMTDADAKWSGAICATCYRAITGVGSEAGIKHLDGREEHLPVVRELHR